MAGKYALYLPYHLTAALEAEGFSDAELGAFVRGVIKYHQEGTPPRFEDRSLNLLFSSSRPEFDNNIERYRAKIESCRENGKKGGGEVVFPKQPETTTIFNLINESKKAGFTLDRKIAGRILAGNLVDPAWLSGPFSFVEFSAATVQDLYPSKSPAEQKRLFISSFEWGDLLETYPAWQEQRKQEAEAKQQQEAVETEVTRKAKPRIGGGVWPGVV